MGLKHFHLQHSFPRVSANKLQPFTSPGVLKHLRTSPLETLKDKYVIKDLSQVTEGKYTASGLAKVAVFSDFYGIDEYNLKDIDRYIWQLGKEYFPKNYKKKTIEN